MAVFTTTTRCQRVRSYTTSLDYLEVIDADQPGPAGRRRSDLRLCAVEKIIRMADPFIELPGRPPLYPAAGSPNRGRSRLPGRPGTPVRSCDSRSVSQGARSSQGRQHPPVHRHPGPELGLEGPCRRLLGNRTRRQCAPSASTSAFGSNRSRATTSRAPGCSRPSGTYRFTNDAARSAHWRMNRRRVTAVGVTGFEPATSSSRTWRSFGKRLRVRWAGSVSGRRQSQRVLALLLYFVAVRLLDPQANADRWTRARPSPVV